MSPRSGLWYKGMDLLEAMTRMNAEANVADPSEYHLQPISDGWSVLVLPPSSEPQARFASTVQWEQPNTLALGLALYICWMAWRRKGSRLRAVAHIGTFSTFLYQHFDTAPHVPLLVGSGCHQTKSA